MRAHERPLPSMINEIDGIIGTGIFNSHAGTTIMLPTPVESVGDYGVIVMPGSSSGFIGDVWVDKTINAFTVRNSGSDTTTEFCYIVVQRLEEA